MGQGARTMHFRPLRLLRGRRHEHSLRANRLGTYSPRRGASERTDGYPKLINKRLLNLRNDCWLWPYLPALFSSTYTMMWARTDCGNCGAANIRLMRGALRPEALCLPWRSVHVVLRKSPSAWACSFRWRNPAVLSILPIFLIFDSCLAFISLRDSHDEDGPITSELKRFFGSGLVITTGPRSFLIY
jgi:hypothetical protein